MRVVKRKEYTRVSEVTESVTCDICGSTGDWSGFNPEFEYEDPDDIYSKAHATIFYEKSHSNGYPGGGCAERLFFDLCPSCFEKHILPTLTLLVANLAAATERTDW
jgi:hypothetical protein